MPNISLASLGCSKNLVDSEVMLGQLTQAGYKIVTNHDEADIIIVNTCAFIGPAKEESIETRFCYPPLSLQQYLSKVEQTSLENSIDIAQRILWLPSSTKLNEKDLEKIVTTVNKFFK